MIKGTTKNMNKKDNTSKAYHTPPELKSQLKSLLETLTPAEKDLVKSIISKNPIYEHVLEGLAGQMGHLFSSIMLISAAVTDVSNPNENASNAANSAVKAGIERASKILQSLDTVLMTAQLTLSVSDAVKSKTASQDKPAEPITDPAPPKDLN